MTEEEKIRKAHDDLEQIKRKTNKINNLCQRYDELKMSLYGTGIDYSRDRVQTTPHNTMEDIICDKLVEIESQIDGLIDLRDKAIRSIYNIEDDQECNILIDVYVNNKSIREIAANIYMSKSSAHRLLKKALTSYYNTKYGIDSLNY